MFRKPMPEDGVAVHELIDRCIPLDTNSLYCNLLQCSHFADTSVAAVTSTGELAGFISGYKKPSDVSRLFVWQVAVAKEMRGLGLGKQMLQALLRRPSCASICYLETSITDDNRASWRLFESLAKDLDAEVHTTLFFDRYSHFADRHDTEQLLRIGPITREL